MKILLKIYHYWKSYNEKVYYYKYGIYFKDIEK